MEHTATPWKQYGQYQIRDSKNRILLSTADAKTMENEKNCEFIITACNNYENLVEAIKILRNEIDLLLEQAE